MKSKFVLLFLVVFTSTAAWSLSPEQVKKAYLGCKTYLTFSVAKKKAVAQKTGIPVEKATRSCEKLVAMGLAKALKYEAEYQRALRAGCPRGYYKVARFSCCPHGTYPSGKYCYYPSSGGSSGGEEPAPTATPEPTPTPAPVRCEPAGTSCDGFTRCCSGYCSDSGDGRGAICG